MSSPVIGSSTLANINGAAASSSTKGVDSGSELNERFMTLLVTQLKNQDPTSPMENSDMTAQLAQINTVSGIEKLNDSLSAITDQIDAGQALQATALIGQGVMVPGNEILVGSTEGSDSVVTTPIGVELNSAVEDLQIDIRGASGEIIDSFSTGPLKAGVHSFTWDGKLADGTSVTPNSTYTASLTGSVGDETYAPTALNYALVNGVIQGANGPKLDLGYAQDPVALSEVRQIL
ncbi:flagellar hook assembly protein FlgD [Salinicola socius]|uniref:Basal-body rod modification protein FlgD n=1 Tax=Salinicola socius TaxID=404433 RepID=A0A1Q8SVY9_9GAMM|nr:flagellar hook assembly protein FlgD [Salinicola socius]OLO05587.1 flagellar basal body rod modification protein [Salinicola socius]